MFDFISSIPNRLLAAAGLLALVVIALIGADSYQNAKAVEDLLPEERLLASKDDIVHYDVRQIADPQSPGRTQEVVAYDYVTEQAVPPTTYLGLKENIEKRTPTAQFYLKSTRQISENKQESEYVGKFFTKPNWVKVGNEWRQIETATTTKVAFERQTKLTLLDRAKRLLGEPAYAVLESYYSGSGDGYVENGYNTGDWSTARSAATGSLSSDTFTLVAVGSQGAVILLGLDFAVYRGFLPFDTSALPDSDLNITSAVLQLKDNTNQLTNGAANSFITVVQTTQASNTALTTADFDQCGALNNPTEGISSSARVTSTMLSNNVYASISLNATGRSWISQTGYTKLGLRHGYDVTNTDPGASDEVVSFFSSEETGTGSDPYLEITYVILEPAKAIINDGGKIIIHDGGKLKID